MSEIKENGVVRWKGFVSIMAGLLVTVFLYADAKMVSKAEFMQFEKRFESFEDRIELSLREMKMDLRQEIRALKK